MDDATLFSDVFLMIQASAVGVRNERTTSRAEVTLAPPTLLE